MTLGMICLLAISYYIYFVDLGKSYSNIEDLKKFQQSRGFLFMGQFGDSWPARVKKIEIVKDEIEFQLTNGAKHSYSDLNGYEIKLLRLSGKNNQEIVVLFRSESEYSE